MLQRSTKGQVRTKRTDEMKELTVGCMASEEEGGCTSPRLPASLFWLICQRSRRETEL